MPVRAPDFARLLAPGTTYPSPDGAYRLVVRVLPEAPLSLPTGRVIAMEPFLCGYGDPAEAAFTQQVPPGTYPVVLAAVDVLDAEGVHHGDTRVAAARLVIRDEPVARWDLAVTPGQDTAELGEDEYFGYPVDGGTGCFVDAGTFQALAGEADFGEQVVSAMYRMDPSAPAGSVPQAVDDPVTMEVGGDEHGLVVFSTGWGDGTYPTWIGRTAGGDVACFLTDFQVLSDEDERVPA
jgi:hypothetical protein